MSSALKEYLSGIIDYAGTFPPAKLSLDVALKNYSQYIQGQYSWMLGRIVLSASSLEQVSSIAKEQKLFDKSPAWRISAVFKLEQNAENFLKNLTIEMEHVREFGQLHSFDEVLVDSLEIPLPEEILKKSEEELIDLFSSVTFLANDLAVKPRIFLEGSFGVNPGYLCTAINKFNLKFNEKIALKVRTGGVVPSAVPTPEQLSQSIASAAKEKIAIKATAGMHDPIRHMDENVGCKLYGFLNFFTACLMAYKFNLEGAPLTEILKTERVDVFHFEREWFSFQNKKFNLSEIKKIRREWALSFGSCSLLEPVEFLRQYGLLDEGNLLDA